MIICHVLSFFVLFSPPVSFFFCHSIAVESRKRERASLNSVCVSYISLAGGKQIKKIKITKCVKLTYSQEEGRGIERRRKITHIPSVFLHKHHWSCSAYPMCTYVWVCVCMFLYTTGTQLNPTLITIRLVIDHTHAVSIDPACAVL